ncbi:MAG: hypothetical protein ISQ13_04670 [Candidatus Margulisbacteria bacterium]|nr:hypothetical protein [Candidatus Margulisiibacteriota bacterium]
MIDDPFSGRDVDDTQPKYYQEFRRLYNELLGYFERNETEKIHAFTQKLDASLHRSVHLYRWFDSKLREFKKQQNIVQKEALYQQFKHPAVTIEVTHPFPLAISVADQPEPAPLPSNTSDSLKKERQLHELVDQMAKANHNHTNDTQLDQPNVPPSSRIDASTPSPSGRHIRQQPASSPRAQAPSPDGTSLNDQFFDKSLYIKKKHKKDVSRATQEQSSAAPPNEGSRSDATQSSSPDAQRKARIWDYIDNDQSSGGMSHDI